MEHTTFIYLVHPLNKDTEATTLWIEHMRLSQQRYRYRGNNIVHRTHDLHIFHLSYGRTYSCNTSRNNWARLETIATDCYFEIRLGNNWAHLETIATDCYFEIGLEK